MELQFLPDPQATISYGYSNWQVRSAYSSPFPDTPVLNYEFEMPNGEVRVSFFFSSASEHRKKTKTNRFDVVRFV